jgi:hypothetical protein
MMMFFSFEGVSQNTQESTTNVMGTIIASGDDASGSYGSVSYSIGQVFYTYIGQSVYNVAQGVQHDLPDNILSTAENSIEPKIEIFIFPNPTTDFITINMEGLELGYVQRSYQLYDIQGRILKQNTISQTETQINLSYLSSSIYILQVYGDNEIIKTFKIIKN